MIWSYFYPRSPCGERQYYSRLCFQSQHISIHALLAESDAETAKTSNADTIFLSTLSLRRATFQGPRLVRHGVDFYPRSPCGERREQAIKAEQTARISIHALLAESDPQDLIAKELALAFLSTLSLRRATRVCRRRWRIP